MRKPAECPSCHLELQETRGTMAVSVAVSVATYLLLIWLLGDQTLVPLFGTFAVVTTVRILFGRWRERVPNLTTLHLH